MVCIFFSEVLNFSQIGYVSSIHFTKWQWKWKTAIQYSYSDRLWTCTVLIISNKYIVIKSLCVERENCVPYSHAFLRDTLLNEII